MICKLDTDNVEVAGSKVRSLRNGWTEYSVDVERQFVVFGLGVFQGKLRFLIDLSDNGRPLWLDSSDFRPVTSDIPPSWVSASFDDEWSFVLGYEELVRSDAHFNGLLEREERDLAIFQKVKTAHGSAAI